VSVGGTQTHLVTVRNLSEKAQGMTVATISTSACDDIDMNQLSLLKE